MGANSSTHLMARGHCKLHGWSAKPRPHQILPHGQVVAVGAGAAVAAGIGASVRKKTNCATHHCASVAMLVLLKLEGEQVCQK